ncbi:MAG TPA: tripartite tricarboxylate transporter substrate binding protein [Burkholderiales bacterium]|nr:tripartite tricarboxylate transporter substrate binding protein [Burkholderiales bacterium]
MISLIRPLMLVACAGATVLAQAQGYATKPVRMVVPYSAGGGLDALARAIGERLFEALGQQVLVDNKPGANTVIGTEYVAKSEPDGYTLLLTEPALVINPSLYSKVPYDPFRDFAPITGLVAVNQALVVTPALPVKNIRELIELAKSKPGELTYASFGAGSSGHLNMEMFQAMAGIRLNHIPYKGAAPALTDVAGGHVQMMFGSVGVVRSQWKTGKVRMLAVGSANRLAQYPDVPTVAEAGLAGFEATAWLGLFAPAGTPREVINRVNAEVQKIFADPAFREKNLEPQAFDPIVTSPDRFSEYIKTDALKWGKVVRDAKVKLD